MSKKNKINLNMKFYCKCLIILFMLISSCKSFANNLNEKNLNGINDIYICKSDFFLSICVDLDKKYLVNLKLLNDPYRIILDFDKKLNFPSHYDSKKVIKNNLFNNTRFAQNMKNKSRLVFELNEPAIISEIFYKQNKNYVVLKIGITKTSRTSFSIAKHVLVQKKGNVTSLNLKNTKKYYEKVEKK